MFEEEKKFEGEKTEPQSLLEEEKEGEGTEEKTTEEAV